MNHQHYNVIGIMSGTSLDGIDLVYVELIKSAQWNFQILAQQCVPYTAIWKKRLQEGVNLNQEELEVLDKEYTALLAQVCVDFISKNKLHDILAVCSHGHTILHQPAQGITLQIGNQPEIAALIGERVVCDFRAQDVKLGGQGAPLVPIGDRLLFSNYDYCLNLGGFANLSREVDNCRVAYDICAVNVVLNHYASLLGSNYDAGGAFAKAGSPQPQQLQELNELPYYSLQAPKSLGIEWVVQNVFPILKSIVKPVDALATYTEHAAMQIAANLDKNSKVFITGGGAYNKFLIERLQHYQKIEVSIPASDLVEYKEALIFALLGVLRLRNENNCLASVTGAVTDHCSGEIYVP